MATVPTVQIPEHVMLRVVDMLKWWQGVGPVHITQEEPGELDPAGTAFMAIFFVIYFSILFLSLFLVVGQLLALCLYYIKYIKPTEGRYLAEGVEVPQETKGRFLYGVCDCTGECSTCLCFLCCSPCSIADLWYRTGWSITLCKDQSSCMNYHTGLGLVMVTNSMGCLPCLLGGLRGGVGGLLEDQSGRIEKLRPIRNTFGIPVNGMATFLEDCLLWGFCLPCVATQEYRQVSAALDRMPLNAELVQVPQQQAMPGMVAPMASPAGAPLMLNATPGPAMMMAPSAPAPVAPVMGQLV